jgi:hypothetical protein
LHPVKMPSRAVLGISQTVLVVAVIMSSTWLSTVSYATGQVTIDNAVDISVIPNYETASPGGSVTVTLVISNPSPSATFIATACLLWYRVIISWVLVQNCLDQSFFPHYFPPHGIEVWVITEPVSPTFPPSVLQWKMIGVGYWGTITPLTTSLTPAISQWAYFTVTIL